MATLTLSSIMSASSPEVVREQRRKAELPSGTFKATLTGIKVESFRGREGDYIEYDRVHFKVGKVEHSVSIGRIYVKPEAGNKPVRGARERIAVALRAGHSIDVTMTSFEDDRTGKRGYDISM